MDWFSHKTSERYGPRGGVPAFKLYSDYIMQAIITYTRVRGKKRHPCQPASCNSIRDIGGFLPLGEKELHKMQNKNQSS